MQRVTTLAAALVGVLLLAGGALGQDNSTYAYRTQWYIEYSADEGGNDLWADVARAHVGRGALSSAYLDAVEKLADRIDGSDFLLPAIAMLLFKYNDSPIMTEDARTALRGALLSFQYWIDEGGYHGNLQYWSENHAVLYHASEYVIGAHMSNETFSNSGMTGAEHRDKGRALLERWMDVRSRVGFTEYCSEVYASFVTAALALVVELGPDADIATRAASLLDLQMMDLMLGGYAGAMSTYRGRTYDTNKIAASEQSTARILWLLTGTGIVRPAGRGAVSLAASNRYTLPAAVEEACRASLTTAFTATGRVGISTAEGPSYGVGYTDPADGIVWFGMGAYAAPDTVELFFDVADAYDLWEHEVWEPIAPLRPLADTGVLPLVTELAYPISYGPVLGPVSTSVYRTPYGALGTAVEYHASMGAMQQHTWQATLGGDALVFVTHPGPVASGYAFAEWTGAASMPRASAHENVLVALHQPPWPATNGTVYPAYTHAYFPADAFDEVTQANGWTFGRLGDAYIGLYSARPTRWQTEGDYRNRELIADGGAKNIWIAEIGDVERDGSFDAFATRVGNGTVTTRWEDGTGIPGDGLVACIHREECFDPEDPVGSLTDCIVRVPIVNPNPPCQDYADITKLAACAAGCGSEDIPCLAKCVYDNVAIDPPTYTPGAMSVVYTDTTGREVAYSWDEPLSYKVAGGEPVQVVPETFRYRNPFMTAPWDARTFTIEAGGAAHCIDFDAPSRAAC